MDKNNFQVVITNQLKPDQDKNLITQKLAALFKTDDQKAAQLLIKPRTIIKDNLDEATARKYHAAIQQTGAHCEVINKKDGVDLPRIVEPRICLIALALGVASAASAQTTEGVIFGTVTDAQGGVLPDVTVTVRNVETGIIRTAVTEADGQYRVPALQPGRYDITALDQQGRFDRISISVRAPGEKKPGA